MTATLMPEKAAPALPKRRRHIGARARTSLIWAIWCSSASR